MAGNTRGKLKEQFEGVHNNNNWAIDHCTRALALIANHKPELSESISSLGEAYKSLDDLAQNIYSRL